MELQSNVFDPVRSWSETLKLLLADITLFNFKVRADPSNF